MDVVVLYQTSALSKYVHTTLVAIINFIFPGEKEKRFNLMLGLKSLGDGKSGFHHFLQVQE